MATLVLTAAASALTAGAPLWLAAAATVAASVAGAVIDQNLFGRTTEREGPRLSDLQVQNSNEGAAIPAVAGRIRLAGQVIWATRFKEVASTSSSGGGKGGGGGSRQKVTTYSYYANFAVGLCEGAIDRVWRVWADGKVLDLSTVTMRVYPGDHAQLPDPLIEGIEGAGQAPAYRGTAYVVFEELAIEAFGNRLPQLTFEVTRRVAPAEPGLEDMVRAVTLIPASGEFAYDTHVITKGGYATPSGTLVPENRSASDTRADLLPALDDLAAALPAVRRVFLTVGWFGDDLRAGHCTIRPRAELASKFTFDGRAAVTWRVHGQDRAAVPAISIDPASGRIAFGGTPDDRSLVRAIRELKARGYQVVIYPFLFMDIAAGNTLPDPYSDHGAGSGQPAYPWRGRITAAVAPGYAGSLDGSAAAAVEVAAFLGSVTRGQVAVSVGAGDAVGVSYSGPAEWSYRRMILHYAKLAAAVNALDPGAVTGFLLGSELRGLTTLRDAAGSYPFVAGLRTLAADCRAVLGPGVALTYGADWSEYFGHQPADGSGDVRCHLDPLWADPAIDAVGIDNYLPLADWRDGDAHLDALAGFGGPQDAAYLDANVEGGERFDWYYASDADRATQRRTPITDGAYGKPWVFRPKDFRAWWSNVHHERPGGSEAASPTAWVPMSKPLWFTELGLPSVDRGANQPNVFYDPKSSESALPYFSAGARDDIGQRKGLEAWLRRFGPDSASNPVSPLYGGRMVGEIAVWTWDARPFPAWPARDDLWGDGDLWPLGHWLNGKVGLADLGGLVTEICARAGLDAGRIDVSALRGVVTGYLRDRAVSPRSEIESLMQAFSFDAVESGGVLRFLHRGGEPHTALTLADLTEAKQGESDLTVVRAQDIELPAEVAISYVDGQRDYRSSSVTSRRLAGGARGRRQLALPLVLDEGQALGIAERLLIEAWTGRDALRFALPPSLLRLDPGDVVTLETGVERRILRIGRIVDEGTRRIEAVTVEPASHRLALPSGRPGGLATLTPPAGLAFAILDLPLIDETVAGHRPFAAAATSPAAAVAVTSSIGGDTFAANAVLPLSATMGVTTYPLYDGPADFWDEGNVLGVELFAGTLASVPRDAVLSSDANALAVLNPDGEWEILQFAEAAPVSARRYDLRGLLRGRLGTEQAMRAPVPAGAMVVLLDGALRPLELTLADRNVARLYRYGPAALPEADPSWEETSFTARAVGLRPYAPAHVTGTRDGAGNLTIRWIRRTRSGGTWCDSTDVPLAEEAERYEVDILDGAGPAVKRTIAATAPEAVYTAAEAAADFGWVPSVVVLRVFQLSAMVGRGPGATATI
ncbi:glycoside hydrolase TIM-barrel-like domain-containing protein [Zavarzinia sp.]|uniref:baseplate multidomain protein megatron n=1 Tax=Zavarzinia sp. TaxID=2027920 RepID=UPI0035626B36